ncbi:TonB-dependent receptor [Pseudomonas corrugata]
MKEDNVSGLLSASYRFSDAVMGYVSWSRGYKAGGINFDVVGPFAAPTFEPERATSLELGMKTRFWDERALLDLAVYQTDVDNYQALTYSPSTSMFAPPLRDNLINVGKVRMHGIELDSAWHLSPDSPGAWAWPGATRAIAASPTRRVRRPRASGPRPQRRPALQCARVEPQQRPGPYPSAAVRAASLQRRRLQLPDRLLRHP